MYKNKFESKIYITFIYSETSLSTETISKFINKSSSVFQNIEQIQSISFIGNITLHKNMNIFLDLNVIFIRHPYIIQYLDAL